MLCLNLDNWEITVWTRPPAASFMHDSAQPRVEGAWRSSLAFQTDRQAGRQLLDHMRMEDSYKPHMLLNDD